LELLLKLHELCFKGSKHFAGKFRNVNVVVRNSLGMVLHAGVPKEELIIEKISPSLQGGVTYITFYFLND